jgi:hypothetical protein
MDPSVISLLANISKASACRTDIRKNKKKLKEVAFFVEKADGGEGSGHISDHKETRPFTFLV